VVFLIQNTSKAKSCTYILGKGLPVHKCTKRIRNVHRSPHSMHPAPPARPPSCRCVFVKTPRALLLPQPASIPAETSPLLRSTSASTHATCSPFRLTQYSGRSVGGGQASGRGDAVRAVQEGPNPHLAGGAHRDRHQELPPARAPGARHQRGLGQARHHLRL
jgi:hypothetical protein